MIRTEQLMQIFGHFDGDQNGRIDRGEFARLMAALGVAVPEEELDVCFSDIDEDGDGTIDFHEFKGWWMDR